jgi:hypothetical protein
LGDSLAVSVTGRCQRPNDVQNFAANEPRGLSTTDTRLVK